MNPSAVRLGGVGKRAWRRGTDGFMTRRMGGARRTVTKFSGAGSAGGPRIGSGSRPGRPTLPLPGPRGSEPRVSDRLLPVDVNDSPAPRSRLSLHGGVWVGRGGGGQNGKTLHQAVYPPPLLVVVAVRELHHWQGTGSVWHGRAPPRGRGHGVNLRHCDARIVGDAAIPRTILLLVVTAVAVVVVVVIVEGQHLCYGADAGGRDGGPLVAASRGGLGAGSGDAVVLYDVADDGPAETAGLEVLGHVLAPLLNAFAFEGRQVDA